MTPGSRASAHFGETRATISTYAQAWALSFETRAIPPTGAFDCPGRRFDRAPRVVRYCWSRGAGAVAPVPDLMTRRAFMS